MIWSIKCVTVSNLFTIFCFPLKSKMAVKRGKNLNFSPLENILPVSQKFARNRSICYSFQDCCNFLFSAKIQDQHQKWRKLKLSFVQDDPLVPCGSKIHSKSLYRLQFEIFVIFQIFTKTSNNKPLLTWTLINKCETSICYCSQNSR